jgi:adenylosuccinate lyase
MENGIRDNSMMSRFDTISPLDYRYYGDNSEFFEKMRPYVSESANIKYLLRVELSLARALAHFGICPKSVPLEIEKACSKITASDVYAEENVVHHNIRAIVNCIRRNISEESRPYVHLFATSNDIMDTAYALRYKELARDVLLPDLIALEKQHLDMLSRGL